MDLRSRIGEFVRRSLGSDDLGDHDNIFEAGDASSLFAMELVLFIEEKLGIPLSDDDLQRSNFETVDDMVRLVETKSASTPTD